MSEEIIEKLSQELKLRNYEFISFKTHEEYGNIYFEFIYNDYKIFNLLNDTNADNIINTYNLYHKYYIIDFIQKHCVIKLKRCDGMCGTKYIIKFENNENNENIYIYLYDNIVYINNAYVFRDNYYDEIEKLLKRYNIYKNYSPLCKSAKY